MSEVEGRAAGEALLEHPEHEIYDEAMPGELQGLERMLKIRLPPSLKGLLQVGSGGVLASGALLLGTKDPEELGSTLHAVATEMWKEGLPPQLLPFVDGDRFFCLDLARPDDAGECEVVEVDPDSFEILRRLGGLPAFVREVLLPS